ncbi:beta-lactamase/transpeptidase-like protein [Dothidotthia symphoricarpi CBS 119687]|uniref:Beta-lactamase/transpeptidase-like protein n=1 Tax=Dothidotthia symphoricarpi CBS 119687 TaxID=1392245 RepID=A0A6A5ZZT1_9PLEO|nr:beta-lactamase/transpeptidase-like protein [Dothidotthia symphoricarpi CBS 119687]KAF2124403.1 beta-lactamase/transpeptidase-like protein [Dothidotthia symphoricarpi CBS 119687]
MPKGLIPRNMKRLRQKTPAFRNSDESITTPIWDDGLEEDIMDILRQCGTHTATISVRRQSRGEPSEQRIKTIVTTSNPLKQQATAGRGERFHIASITKILVATAIFIAFEKQTTDRASKQSSTPFRQARDAPLTKVYNHYSSVNMKAIPEDPIIYDLLVHRNGFPSLNHRMLAPDGQSIMGRANVREELLSQPSKDKTNDGIKKSWAGYSNVNYTAVAMAIEAIWNGSLESFMDETLFRPLGMHSTSIGVPNNESAENRGWVVDSNGKPHEIQRPLYRADGAEAAALGAYSTAHDLDIFFKFITDTFYNHEPLPIPGFDLSDLAKVLKMTYSTGESLRFTPLGLYTPLSSSVIGALSTNRAQFPTEPFSTYAVIPEPGDNDIAVYYMAGSAVACSCATALHVGEESSFAVVVLTNTSGPVDAADHILRLILQRMAKWTAKGNVFPRLLQPGYAKEMVRQARIKTLQRWKEVEQKHAQDVRQAPAINKDIEGVFKGVGFGQRLSISKKQDGKMYITVDGPSALPLPTEFELVWVDSSSITMYIPPHLSVDCLGEGDWSNVVFRVEEMDHTVVALLRTTRSGEDRFSRISSNS